MIDTGMDHDAGGSDIISDTVAGAVAAAEAQYRELESDVTDGRGVVGDLIAMPTAPDVDSTVLGSVSG